MAAEIRKPFLRQLVNSTLEGGYAWKYDLGILPGAVQLQTFVTYENSPPENYIIGMISDREAYICAVFAPNVVEEFYRLYRRRLTEHTRGCCLSNIRAILHLMPYDTITSGIIGVDMDNDIPALHRPRIGKDRYLPVLYIQDMEYIPIDGAPRLGKPEALRKNKNIAAHIRRITTRLIESTAPASTTSTMATTVDDEKDLKPSVEFITQQSNGPEEELYIAAADGTLLDISGENIQVIAEPSEDYQPNENFQTQFELEWESSTSSPIQQGQHQEQIIFNRPYSHPNPVTHSETSIPYSWDESDEERMDSSLPHKPMIDADELLKSSPPHISMHELPVLASEPDKEFHVTIPKGSFAVRTLSVHGKNGRRKRLRYISPLLDLPDISMENRMQRDFLKFLMKLKTEEKE
ncbi:hypothetical protein V1514DRAFT_337511 [Lipomyces japonicus]|uniref:uncharacterized protein n=1 Tax=Lipomyces japonicus TaxID=56871 RepID=UPI0034CFD426